MNLPQEQIFRSYTLLEFVTILSQCGSPRPKTTAWCVYTKVSGV